MNRKDREWIKRNNREWLDKLYSVRLRAENVIHLAAQAIKYPYPDIVKNSFNSDWDVIWEAIGLKSLDPTEGICDEISSYLIEHNKLGFLIQFATPVPEDTDRPEVVDYYSHNGWGYYQTKWIYAETVEDCYILGLKWLDEYLRGFNIVLDTILYVPNYQLIVKNDGVDTVEHSAETAEEVWKLLTQHVLWGLATVVSPTGKDVSAFIPDKT